MRATLTVCPAGPPTCDYTSPQAAVDAAVPGDTVKVAEGTYTDLHGRPAPPGYDGPEVITQVVYLTKTLTLQGGYTDAFTEPPDPVAHPTTLDAQGGGRVLLIAGPISPTVAGLRITGGDAAGLVGSSYHDVGGGIYVMGTAATITGNIVYSNTAAVPGECGGLIVLDSAALVEGNAFLSNTASNAGGGVGLVDSSATFARNTVAGNRAYLGGGLLLVDDESTVIGNTIVGNQTEAGGGVYAHQTSEVLFSGNAVLSNTAASGNGGGVYLYSSSLMTLTNNLIAGNTALGKGGGIYAESNYSAVFTNTLSGNTAEEGGGLYVSSGGLRLVGNRFQGNRATGGGGGFFANYSTAVISGNLILRNRAGRGGGGVIAFGGDELINNVLAENEAAEAVGGLLVAGGTPRLRHNTVARNGGGDGSGVYVGNDAVVLLTDTILVSQTVGITVTAGCTAILEATLWGGGAWANGRDWGGAGTIVTGTVNLWGDPLFHDPAADDYHLVLGSPAIDAGVDAGVRVDLDGERRPYGQGYDIGADEFPSGLHLSKHASAAAVPPLAPLTYTLALTNSGLVPLTVVLTDTLPAHVTPTGVLTWTTALTPGAVWTAVVPVRVTLAEPGLLTNTLAARAAEGAAGLVVDVVAVQLPITGLVAFNDGPTALGLPTTLSATVAAGSDIVYTWDLGSSFRSVALEETACYFSFAETACDGTAGHGAVVTHTYPAAGLYTATVTATNGLGWRTARTVVEVVPRTWRIYLPVVGR